VCIYDFFASLLDPKELRSIPAGVAMVSSKPEPSSSMHFYRGGPAKTFVAMAQFFIGAGLNLTYYYK
jgi:hypothetical protein